tara:strand:- start:314 stop:1045 length:732 start_codon:yes stop_codon:yes gene_type:complete
MREEFPRQMGQFKIKPKRKTAQWKDFDVARLQISMDNEKQTGEKLKNAVDWCCSGRFEKVVAIVSDTLNWFNLSVKHDLNKEDALKLALSEGDDWLSRNNFLHDYNIEIKRWDEWMLHPEYENRLSIIRKLFLTNEAFKSNVNVVSDRIMESKLSDLTTYSESHLKRFGEMSKEYILCELSVFSIMFNEEEAIEIYPGSWLKDIFEILCTYSRQYDFLECFNNKPYLQIEFEKNKSFEGQPLV